MTAYPQLPGDLVVLFLFAASIFYKVIAAKGAVGERLYSVNLLAACLWVMCFGYVLRRFGIEFGVTIVLAGMLMGGAAIIMDAFVKPAKPSGLKAIGKAMRRMFRR